MTRLTPSDQAGTGSAPGTATIPPQRSPRSLRLLVLGTGDPAASLRARAADAGAELAQRLSSRVTHVVVDETVGDDDSRVARARTAGLPVLSLEQGEELLGGKDEIEEVEVEGEVEAVGAETADVGVMDVEVMSPEVVGVGAAEEIAVEPVTEVPEVAEAWLELGPEADADAALLAVAAGVAAGVDEEDEDVVEEMAVGVDEVDEVESGESIALVRPRSEYVMESQEDGPTNVFAGSALEAVLLFPPLPADDSAQTCGCGEICGDEGGEAGRIGIAGGGSDGLGGFGGFGGSDGAGGSGDSGPAAEVIGMRLSAEAQPEDFGAGVDVAGVMAGDVVLGPDTSANAEDDSAQTPVAAAGSIAWALVPLASLGLLTPVSMGYAAYRLRSRPLAYATACYTIAVTAAFAVSAAAPRGGGVTHSAVSDLLTACLATSWLGGTVHSFLIRRRVFG